MTNINTESPRKRTLVKSKENDSLWDCEELDRLLEQPALVADVRSLFRGCLTIAAPDRAPPHLFALALGEAELGVHSKHGEQLLQVGPQPAQVSQQVLGLGDQLVGRVANAESQPCNKVQQRSKLAIALEVCW